MDVDYLREALRQDAQLVGDPEPNLYEQVRTRRQKSDRRRLTAVAAGLAALLVGIGVTISLNELQRSVDSGQVANPSGIDGHLGLPTRGSLGGDRAFIEAVLQLPWDDAGGVPRPETRHVAFAADLYDQRWALVAGALDDGTVVGTWFFPWAGADAKNLRASGSAQVVAPDQPLTAVRGGFRVPGRCGRRAGGCRRNLGSHRGRQRGHDQQDIRISGNRRRRRHDEHPFHGRLHCLRSERQSEPKRSATFPWLTADSGRHVCDARPGFDRLCRSARRRRCCLRTEMDSRRILLPRHTPR